MSRLKRIRALIKATHRTLFLKVLKVMAVSLILPHVKAPVSHLEFLCCRLAHRVRFNELLDRRLEQGRANSILTNLSLRMINPPNALNAGDIIRGLGGVAEPEPSDHAKRASSILRQRVPTRLRSLRQTRDTLA